MLVLDGTIVAAINAPANNLSATRREGYIYLLVELLIFGVQIENVAIVASTRALAYVLQ